MEYRTILLPASAELTEKRSRFLAELSHAADEAEALAFLSAARRKSREATHHVYAFRAGNAARCSDDGEPQGTSGAPVLEVLDGAGLRDVVFVVTRWFGGTLLGTGGLIRAYSQAARLALAKARIVVMRRCARFRLPIAYRLQKPAETLVLSLCGKITEREYGERVALRFYVPEESVPALLAGLSDLTLGTAAPEPDGFGDFPCENSALF